MPPLAVMIIHLIIGIIVGYLIHKFLKIALIAAVLLVIAVYFGFFELTLGAMKGLTDKYGTIAIQYGTLMLGILPLGIGFIIGAIIGFLISK